MQTIKLQVVGNRSFSVSLPKDWVKRNHLGPKDTVMIEQTPNNHLLIKAGEPSQTKQSEQLNINLDTVDEVSAFMIFCYMKNIDELRLFWKEFNFDKIKEVKRMLQYLDGYDIVKEDEESIEISFLFKDVNITIPHIARRMVYLLKFMVTSLEEKNTDSVDEVERSLDRLYYLGKRILFSCLRSSLVRQSHSIESEDDVFFYRDTFKKIENFGDALYHLKNAALQSKDFEMFKNMLDAIESLLLKHKIVHIDPYSSTSKDKDVQTATNRMNELLRDIQDNALSIYYNKLYFSEQHK